MIYMIASQKDFLIAMQAFRDKGSHSFTDEQITMGYEYLMRGRQSIFFMSDFYGIDHIIFILQYMIDKEKVAKK